MMSYPVLSTVDVDRFVEGVLVRVDLGQETVDGFLDHPERFRATTLDLSELERVGSALGRAALESGEVDDSLELVEHEYSLDVFEAMRDLEPEALGDRDFWSYCAARFFWQFIVLRQQKSVLKARGSIVQRILEPEEGPAGSPPLRRYVLGKDHYQIPLRLFLRAQSIGADRKFLEANVVAEGVDFWRSHVLGVRTGAYPHWARPLVAAQVQQRLTIREQRPPARRINRIRVNVSPILHTEEEARAIVEPWWRSDGSAE